MRSCEPALPHELLRTDEEVNDFETTFEHRS